MKIETVVSWRRVCAVAGCFLLCLLITYVIVDLILGYQFAQKMAGF